MMAISNVQMTTPRKNRPTKKRGLGSYALFSFAFSGWLLFFLAIVYLNPSMSNIRTNNTTFSRNLRGNLPQKWSVKRLGKTNSSSVSITATNKHDDNKTGSLLPVDDAKMQARAEFNSIYKPSNKTMAACLLVNDDTIKLTEWIAYHYTILPLSHLIVAIDPNSLLQDKIISVLDLWKDRLPYLNVWTNDSWMTLNATQGWRQSIYQDPDATDKGYNRWFLDPNSVKGRFHRHNRRQQHFTIQCMRELKRLNTSWVLHTDTDEFMTYNYMEDDEDEDNFDAYRIRENEILQQQHETRIRELRQRVLPIRKKLPTPNVTIADFIAHFQIPGACFHIPGLQISAKESPLAQVSRNVPPQFDGRKFMTMRHRKYGAKSGRFTKAMIDVSKVPWDLLVDEQVVTIHTPVRDVCPENGVSGSGYDYMASVFRLHHYAGTFRSFLERQNDGRRDRLQTFHRRDVEPIGENDDVRPWLKMFVNKVGISEAIELLSPLEKAYEPKDVDAVF